MDKKDIEILGLLQKDASIALADLARAVNLSSTPCWRRVQKLQEAGVIVRQVALCDPQRLNLGLRLCERAAVVFLTVPMQPLKPLSLRVIPWQTWLRGLKKRPAGTPRR